MNSNEDSLIKETFVLFKEKISLEVFIQRLNCLEKAIGGHQKDNFLRGCRLFTLAIRCEEVDQNISMVLICSSIECISNQLNETINFKDWLIMNHLSTLCHLDEAQLKKTINKLSDEYNQHEPLRDGNRYNFVRFLQTHNPIVLEPGFFTKYKVTGSIEQETDLSPDQFYKYVYDKYRSFFVHRGIGRASIPEGSDYFLDLWSGECVRVKGGYKHFKPIVLESLFAFLCEFSKEK